MPMTSTGPFFFAVRRSAAEGLGDLLEACPGVDASHHDSAAMASDLDDIEQALREWFDGIVTGKPAGVLHPESHLLAVTVCELDDMPRAAWFELQSRCSAAGRDSPARNWVVQIERFGTSMAYAKVQCRIARSTFTDYLTFVRHAEGWRLNSRIFHRETPGSGEIGVDCELFAGDALR